MICLLDVEGRAFEIIKGYNHWLNQERYWIKSGAVILSVDRKVLVLERAICNGEPVFSIHATVADSMRRYSGTGWAVEVAEDVCRWLSEELQIPIQDHHDT